MSHSQPLISEVSERKSQRESVSDIIARKTRDTSVRSVSCPCQQHWPTSQWLMVAAQVEALSQRPICSAGSAPLIAISAQPVDAMEPSGPVGEKVRTHVGGTQGREDTAPCMTVRQYSTARSSRTVVVVSRRAKGLLCSTTAFRAGSRVSTGRVHI